MEHIKRALEMVKEPEFAAPARSDPAPLPTAYAHGIAGAAHEPRIAETTLSESYLESRRIIAHRHDDPRARSFDMLRTQVLHTMYEKDWRLVAMTSPTPGCGKTVTAINLALSMSRHPDTSVLLVDMDLRNPRVAKILGLKPKADIVSVLNREAILQDALIQARASSTSLTILPCVEPVTSSYEWMASRQTGDLIQELRTNAHARIVIVDLPPVLAGGDAMPVLAQADCVLFVAAVGTTTAADMREADKHLQSTPIVRVVLNKVAKASHAYY